MAHFSDGGGGDTGDHDKLFWWCGEFRSLAEVLKRKGEEAEIEFRHH